MPDRYRVYRPLHEQDDLHAELMREVIDLSRKVLRQPSPDTFLGRKTQEPFPWEKRKLGTASR